MQSQNEEIKIYKIKEKNFSRRLKNVVIGIVFFSIVFSPIVFLHNRFYHIGFISTSNPVQDLFILIGIITFIALALFIFPKNKAVHTFIINDEAVQIRGNFINKSFEAEIRYQDLKIKLRPVGHYKTFGYELELSSKGKKYLLSGYDDWKTQDFYNILLDIKHKNNRLNIKIID